MIRLWQKLWDRRSLAREEVRVPVRMWVVESAGRGHLTPEHAATAVNLSEDGCCLAVPTLALEGFHLQRCLNSGEDYLLELVLQVPSGGQWRIFGEVAWTNRVWDYQPATFWVGVRFQEPVGLPGNWRRLVRSTPAN